MCIKKQTDKIVNFYVQEKLSLQNYHIFSCKLERAVVKQYIPLNIYQRSFIFSLIQRYIRVAYIVEFILVFLYTLFINKYQHLPVKQRMFQKP